MALDFCVINLEKDSHNRHYNVEIEFRGERGRYEIYTDAHFYFYDWLDNGLNILDGDDRTFNVLPYLRIEALDNGNKRYERELERAILEFIEEECSEKT
jgi:hypothetical protein